MEVIKKKSQEVDQFIIDAIELAKENKEITDCILIPIFEDGSSFMYHTSLRNSDIVHAIEAQKYVLFRNNE